MRIPILACLAIASSAAAQPQPIVAAAIPVEWSRIRFGSVDGGSVTHVRLTARQHPGHIHVTMTLALASRSRTAREVGLPLFLSSQVTAVGLGLETPLGPEVGVAAEPAVARSTYEQIVSTMTDPALLEQLGPERFGLRVYPVARDAPATVTIELALPYGLPLVIERGTSGIREAVIDLGGDAKRHRLGTRNVISLVDAIVEPADETRELPRVDATSSLLARPVDRRPQIVMPSGFHDRVRTLPTTIDYLRDRDVAHAVKLRKEQLRRCFELGEERSASLMLSIGGDGAVKEVSVDDLEHDGSRQCIAREVGAWRFAAFRRSRTLRHALEL
ncbi:MAG: hypothetical protein H0T46_33750 [Deltaproteobacteria bacterium]|nr:hypothetical protein [Deltaproteobacteria bacterium]